jgi:hypothetical protein
MKQANFKGFGASSKGHVSPAIAPINMPDEVVTLCVADKNPQAVAVAHSLNFARARFGYMQLDIAIRCGWKSASYLSEIAHGHKTIPEDRIERFVVATGCNLLGQVIHRHRIEERIAGKETANERNRAVLACMLAVAA